MKISLSSQSLRSLEAEVIVIGVTPKTLATDSNLQAMDKATKGLVRRMVKSEDFQAKKGETLKITIPSGFKAENLLLVGLGKGEITPPNLRAMAVKAADISARKRSLAWVVSQQTEENVRAIAEGLGMGMYRYTAYFTGERKPKQRLRNALIVVDAKQQNALKGALRQGLIMAEAIHLVRDLVNCPPNDLPPRVLADCAAKVSAELGIECRVFDKKRIEKERMNLLLAVNRGSGEEPRLIHMIYKPQEKKPNSKRVIFVGKGLTFDAGGLCIKPSKSMEDMKCDMAGGALTIAVIMAAARLQLPIEVHGIVPSTENLIGEYAYRPGDVYTSLDGKTVEIINTDAEGRLILADALAYALRFEPDVIVDHATLTGACITALGKWTAGLFANNEIYAEAYTEATKSAGESYWRLPLTEELRDSLKSDIADLKHTGDGHGGTITAALFLEEFVGKKPWVHLDIAGPAFLDRAKSIYPKGGSGFGVLTAVRFLEQLSST